MTSRIAAPCTRTIVAGLLMATLSLAASAETVVTNFSNPAAITINGDPGTPYPSTIPVSGLAGNVTQVSVTLSNVSHTFTRDIDVLLVSPQGQQLMLMSDAGGGFSVSNLTLNFSASASSPLPAPLASGTWLPTNRDDSAMETPGNDVFPAPAPGGAPGTDLSVFNGAAASQNGNWHLYVRDDYPSVDNGSIAGGWTLSITRDQFTTCAAEGFSGSKLTLCRQICEIDQTPTRLTSLIRLYMTAYRSEPPCAD